jgi:AmmeMemoRadiSam system protein B
MVEGAWQTPLGEVGIDAVFARQLLKRSRFLKEDCLAHAQEHSLEVELPFLQYFNPDFRIVPIAFMSGNPQALKEIGKEIALSIKVAGREKQTLIIASSDMTHYEPQKQAEAKDKEALAAILELDEDRLIERVRALDISMCGYAPVAVMLSLVKTLGARQAKLIAYQTSGDVSGDYESVVGYAGVVIS